MTAAARLQTVAAIAAWLALGIGAATSALAPWVAVAAAVLTALLWTPWTRASRWVPLLVGLTCIAQALSGVSVVPAAVMGVLVLSHVALADLATDATDATGASARAVGRAVRQLVPGVAAGAAAAAVLTLALTVATELPSPWGAALRPAAPLLLLAAAILALGMTSRRAGWSYLPQRGALSAVTRRYVTRAGEDR